MTEENIVPFNPLNKRHLAESVGQAVLDQPVVTLSSLTQFGGAGLYAIYYTGEFLAYTALAERNRQEQFAAPIYVGRAEPKGSRKGGDLDARPGNVLYSRLTQHRTSIQEASNLSLDDFTCRFLVVDDIWIPLGESLLLGRFTPIWNTLIDGFGNHDPGKGRHAGLRPRWDVLHPGRRWADRCRPRDESAEQIAREAREFLESVLPPSP